MHFLSFECAENIIIISENYTGKRWEQCPVIYFCAFVRLVLFFVCVQLLLQEELESCFFMGFCFCILNLTEFFKLFKCSNFSSVFLIDFNFLHQIVIVHEMFEISLKQIFKYLFKWYFIHSMNDYNLILKN